MDHITPLQGKGNATLPPCGAVILHTFTAYVPHTRWQYPLCKLFYKCVVFKYRRQIFLMEESQMECVGTPPSRGWSLVPPSLSQVWAGFTTLLSRDSLQQRQRQELGNGQTWQPQPQPREEGSDYQQCLVESRYPLMSREKHFASMPILPPTMRKTPDKPNLREILQNLRLVLLKKSRKQD